MPQTTYLYTSADFPQGFEIGRCEFDIHQSAIVTALERVEGSGTTIAIVFKDALSSQDKTTLDGGASQSPEHPPLAGSILANHTGDTYNPVPVVALSSKATSDNRLRVAIEKSEGERMIVISHDFCRPSTWIGQSVRATSQAASEVVEASTPPASPSNDDTYAIGASPSGAWSGKTGQIARWDSTKGKWLFFAPPAGWSFATRALYAIPHRDVIDVAHGLVSDEDLLVHPIDGLSMRLQVRVDSAVQVEEDPHEAAESDDGRDAGASFVANYQGGLLFFYTPLGSGASVEADYCRANGSRFTLQTPLGRVAHLGAVEVQFSGDVVLRDSAIFQVWGNVSAVAPALVGLPASVAAVALKVPLWKDGASLIAANEIVPLAPPKKYKTMRDYQNECSASLPQYLPLGAGNWRGLSLATTVFHWEYPRDIALSGGAGMEIRVWLEHEQPFYGDFATATFYGAYEVVP